ncbi:MAG: ATP-dependent Clp protease ATP-binding subunit [Clostridia bacterium]|nr:ATP-dependent Clp protease ATP-binding subunit [Clostridia bacterium]
MLCCKCQKNLAVVYVSRMDETGKTVNEGYCLTCAKELNLGPIDEMIQKMGINPEEMDSLHQEMNSMMEEMGLDESVEDEGADDGEEMSRSMQKNPFEMMNRLFGGGSNLSKDQGEKKEKPKKNKKRKNLDIYAVNLTEKAKNGEVDRVVGRDAEMERTAQILNRRTKNNPCLIGEPGVGKTAIAEGLALKIIQGQVPAKLLGKEIYLLDMSAVVAGTQFRGQFESRLRNIITEVKEAGNIILVIDEIHTIASAGDAEGGMNAGNILKPALSRGEIQVIGATTVEEYRKHIEKDAALERRFQTVLVDEPSIEETIEILKGIKEYYEEYHKVSISDALIRTATVLAKRYITDRFLPDKAIDVIDEAASKANLENEDLIALEQRKRELDQLEKEEESLQNGEEPIDFEKAAELKSKILQLKDWIANKETTVVKELTVDDLAGVIELWTKIPVKHISEYEMNKLVNLEERLHRRLIGQDEAVSAVARAIRRKRAGISLKKRPVSFIFVGPTGVGKTELVKRIAEEVFEGEQSLIRLDMSEYMEKHSASKLIGSPPGYVGYDDAGQLTEKIRRHPYSVVLLDEIEKAHEDIFNILLQIMDDGRITDSHGKTVSFENTILIMTSNAGSDQRSNVVGFNEEEEAIQLKVERALKSMFRPEFLNRVDETVIFKELKREELLKIIDLMLEDLQAGLMEKKITLSVSDEVKTFILDKAYKKEYGARPLRRFIERHLEDALACKLIAGELSEGMHAEAVLEHDTIVIR